MARKTTAKKATKKAPLSKGSIRNTAPSKRKVTLKKRSVKQLSAAAASYNPRQITDKRLTALDSSYKTYGDLSGVVLNVATDTLIGGHQRIKTLEGKRTKIEKDAHTDGCGTVAVGHIIVVNDDKSLTKIPYREVNWSDVKAEKAANIAANSHGGEFDADKLGALVEELEMENDFEVEVLGLDPLMIRQLTMMDKVSSTPSSTKPKSKASTEDDDDEEEEEGFDEYTEESFEFRHECPKCKFKYN